MGLLVCCRIGSRHPGRGAGGLTGRHVCTSHNGRARGTQQADVCACVCGCMHQSCCNQSLARQPPARAAGRSQLHWEGGQHSCICKGAGRRSSAGSGNGAGQSSAKHPLAATVSLGRMIRGAATSTLQIGGGGGGGRQRGAAGGRGWQAAAHLSPEHHHRHAAAGARGGDRQEWPWGGGGGGGCYMCAGGAEQ